MITKQNPDKKFQAIFDEAPISLWVEDFSEVKKFVDQLKSSGVDDLRAHCESHPETVHECTKRVRIIHVNKATLNLYKVRDEKELLAGMDKTFTEESFAVFQEELLALAEGKTSVSSEAVTKTVTGELVNVVIQASITPGYEDTWAHVLVAITDITERTETEEKFRTITQYSPIGMFLDDADGNAIYINDRCAELVGVPAEEALNLDWIPLIHPDDRERVKAEWVKAVKQGKPFHEDYRWVHPDGKVVWTRGEISPVKDPNGIVTLFIGTLVDITEHKQVEQALHESEKKYRGMVMNLMEGFYSVTLDGVLQEYNIEFCKILGLDPGRDYTGIALPDFWQSPEDRKEYAEEIKLHGFVKNYTVNAKKADGEQIIILINARLIKDDDGAPLLIEGTLLDITQREQAEEALRKSEQKYQLLFDNMINGFAYHKIETDNNGKPSDYTFLEINSAFEELTGLTRAETVGRKVSEVLPGIEDDPADWIGDYGKVALEGKNIHFENFSESLNKWFSIYAYSPRQDYFATIFEDITERKQAEEALRISELQYHEVIETARDAFVSMDTEGNITDWNPQAEAIFGWQRAEILGQPVSETIVPPGLRKKHKQSLKHYLASGEGSMLNKSVETTAQHHDGHTFPVELSIVPIQTYGGRRFNAFIRDITERHEAQKNLKASLVGSIVAISKAVEARDPYTAGHQQRVSQLARCIAQEMGLDSDRIDGLRMGATIHDIGKIYLPAEILSKPSKLTAMEFELIKTHCQVGYDILKDIPSPWPVADIAWQHHERLDGTGYPQGLKGDEICMEARIVAVADVIEAISSHRPYRPALGMDVALEKIEAHRGEWYDADAVDTCLKLFNEGGFSFK